MTERTSQKEELKHYPPPYFYPPPPEEDEIDLYDLWLVLKKRKKTVFVLTFLITLLGVIYILLASPVYETKTRIFPLQSGSSKLSALGALSSFLPVSLPTTQLTVEAILNSRTLKERVIKDLNLMPLLFPKQWDSVKKTWKDPEEAPTILDGVKKLDKLISISTDKKTGVITITVDFPKKPEVAYKIAQTILKETQNILSEKTWTLAKKYRIFLENQISEVMDRLKKLEQIYKLFVQGKIKEVPIIVDLTFINKISEKAHEILGNRTISEEVWKKMLKDWKNLTEKNRPIGSTVTGNVIDFQFNLNKLKWQLKLLQNLLINLLKQYELAKQQEIKESIAFQVVDPPYIPDINKPAKPKKALILAVAFISGLFLGIFGAFFREWIENVRRRKEVQQ